MKKEKNEVVEIELAYKTYDVTKMSNMAIYKLDNVLDMPIMELIYKVTSKVGFKISDAWKIIWACVNVKNPDMTFEMFIEETDKSKIPAIELIEMATAIIGNSFATDEKKKGDSDSKN